MAARGFWRQLRILALLLVLLFVALTAVQNRWRTTDWDQPLWVAVHPINGDSSPAAERAIEGLGTGRFGGIEQFLAREGNRYGVTLRQPVELHLAERVDSRPPAPPADGAWWRVAIWSLQLRYWAWKTTRDEEVPADIELFVVYHDPATRPTLAHSYGIAKALVGVANVFASRPARHRNQVVICHELLHTLGATDKYDPRTDQPLFPAGYAEPERRPLLPQRKAELMAGRVPLSPSRAEMPDSLANVVIGPQTAAEIGW